jgi:gamma-butyrobetaine dioxygenase
MENAMTAFTVDVREHSMEVEWSDGARASFPWIWLIDNEPAAFHPQTEERLFDLTSVADELRPRFVEAAADAIVVNWPGREQANRISAAWLRAHAPGRRRIDPAAIEPMLWRGNQGMESVPRFEAAAVLKNDNALKSWMEETVRYGLSIIDGLEGSPKAGITVAERAGFLRRTNFGVTFEVVSKLDPNNLAYTSHALPLHTDLANQELPPGYQFLHCIANEAEGGGSVFCDGFAVAQDLRDTDPQAFRALAEIEIPFRFHDYDYDIRGRFPVIVCDRKGEVREIRFNAHLVDIIDLEGEELGAFYAAYRKLMCILRGASYARTLRLAAGEMVVFDNRRVLHGRQAFNPATGFRFLNGCYVDRGEFLSRIRVLGRSEAR